MIISLVVALLAAQAVPADTVAAPPLPVAERAYHDRDAEDILRRAREQRDSTRHQIQAYQAIGRERVSLGMRTLGRERIFYRSEHAARIHWRRHGTGRVEVLGARQVTPLFSSRVRVLDDARSQGVGLAFDPADDVFFSDLFGVARVEEDGGNGWFRHPLAPGSEADYQFRSGDTTRIRLPDGTTVRLLELQVIPRRSDSRLIHGSYWFDASTHAPVRAVFRLARAFDLQLDRQFFDADSQEDLDEIPWAVRPLIMPIRADLRFLTVEYALWEGRWWMPRLTAVDAVADVGSLGSFPVRFERAYSDFRVTGAAPSDMLAAVPADPVLTHCPRPPRPPRRGSRRDGAAAEADTLAADTDTTPGRSVAIGTHGVHVTDGSRVEAVVDEDEEARTTRVCRCSSGQCRYWDVQMPRDTERLIASEHLPPSIYAGGETLISGDEFDELVERLRVLAPTGWAVSRPTFAWSAVEGDLLRYNRVEGLSLGARGMVELGALSADATLRLGVPEFEPRGELGASREGLQHRLRLAGYHRLGAVDPLQRPLGLGNSLSALLLGRDEGDYFGATGVELTGSPARSRMQRYEWRLFAEQQREVGKETDFSLPHLFDRDRAFRPNLAAERADQVGASVLLRLDRGMNPTGFRWATQLFTEGSAGTFRFVRPSLALSASTPLPARLLGAVEVAGGTSWGELPAQSGWYLGGSGSVRGYAPLSAGGNAFWRARAEVSNPLPAVRWVLFSDAGWAGPRDDVRIDPLLLSAGAGVSLLDGLIRFDVARALRGERQWRAELYLDGTL
jgi:hypothetical protein